MRAVVAGLWLLACMSAAAAQQTVGPQLTIEQRADVFLARHDFQNALDLLQPLVAAKRADAEVYNRMGIAHQQLMQFKAAENDYKQAIRRDKHGAVYLNNLGTVYFERKDYGAAVKQYRQALRYDTGKSAYYVNLGAALFARKRLAPAMQAFRQALQLDPNALFPEGGAGPVVQAAGAADAGLYHYQLAKLLCSLGQLDDAMHQFRQAQERNYPGLDQSLRDPAFAPLRQRPDYREVMGLPQLTGTPTSHAN